MRDTFAVAAARRNGLTRPVYKLITSVYGAARSLRERGVHPLSGPTQAVGWKTYGLTTSRRRHRTDRHGHPPVGYRPSHREVLSEEYRRDHLGEANAGLQLIMAKGRWRNPRTAMRYVKPGGEAVAEVTELLNIAPPRHG